jgi:hypothetical protein
MRSFWSDPFLWIHLAGLATVPIWLELCLLGLAVGDPVLPVWLELLLVGVAGIAPIVWMQWQRPFNIFSLLAVALKPERLTEEQRQLLTRFTVPRNRFLAIAVSVVLAIVLQKLYFISPIAASITPFTFAGRLGGLVMAAIALLGANLFTQVPVAVASVLLTSEATFAATLPFAIEQIPQRFTAIGLPVNQILPAIMAETPLPQAPPASVNPQATDFQIPVTPSEPVMPTVTMPLNADDLDDVWGSEDTTDNSPAVADISSGVTSAADSDRPVEKPDLTVAEVKPEEDIKDENPVAVVSELDQAAVTEADWLDSPAIDDPASAETQT